MKYLIGVIAIGAIIMGMWVLNVNQNTDDLQKENTVGIENLTPTDELEDYKVATIDYVDTSSLISTNEATDLSQEEIDGLVFMREEEKLARDVYLTLYDTWGITVFNNIAGSEMTHMDAILTLLDRYRIADPASLERGVFTNADLQSLYNELVETGKGSKLAALNVGAKIEDLDIRDLNLNMSATNNPDILAVYESLQRGSRNHLRAFNRQIQNESGENYSPEFISSDDFSTIISTGVERGGEVGQGRGLGKGNGKNN